MLKLIKNLLERNSLILAIGTSVFVLIMSLINLKGFPTPNFSYFDKLEHIFAYATISFFWMLSHKLGKIKVSLVYLFVIISAYGVLIEALQSYLTTNRTGDLFDIVANIVGVIIGYIILKLLSHLYLQV